VTKNKLRRVHTDLVRSAFLQGFVFSLQALHFLQRNKIQNKTYCLELRRLHIDLLFCYKIVFGLVDINFSDFFEFCDSGTRGHAYKLFKSRCNKGVRSQFFAERVVKVWNSLPTTTNFATLPLFRQSIMCVDFSAFLKVF